MATIIDGSLTPRGGVISFPNGTKWTLADSMIDGNCVYYADGIWFIGGSSSYYSTDGKTWTEIGLPAADIYAVHKANGLWVAGGYAGLIYSTDGINWTVSDINGGYLDIVRNANGVWVASSQSTSVILYSDDGKTWFYNSLPFTIDGMIDIRYADGVWIGLTNDGSVIKSINGKDWDFLNTYGFMAINNANGLWVAGYRTLYWSDDNCQSWKAATGFPTDSKNYVDIIYHANGIWVCSSSLKGIYYSTDGKTWTQSNMTSGRFSSIHYANGLWVAGGWTSNNTYYSFDGKTWTQSNMPTDVAVRVYAANGLWVAVGAGAYYSPTWEAPPPVT